MSAWLTITLALAGPETAQVSDIPDEKVHVARRTAKPDMVLVWNDVALQAVRKDRTPPPLAARNLAVMHVAVYDAVNAIYRTHQPYLVDTRGLPGASPSAAAAVAAHRTLVSLYPKQARELDEVLHASLAEVTDAHSRGAGVMLGRFVAEQVLERRAKDAECLVGKHIVRRGPGIWEPTATAYADAVLPAWVNLSPFCIRAGCLPRPKGPPALKSAEYAEALREVYELGGKHSRKRTQEQTEIAHFWADGEGTVTPPGHWNRIAAGVALERGNNLMDNARLFALLNMSLSDAGLACWIIKFHFNVWRPLTAIHRAEEDDNPDTTPDAHWQPLLATPPFPAYTSGHSTFSAAAASVLAKYFGTDEVRFETTSEGLPGARRSFASFSAAAAEAGQSRIYGGIHYQFDNRDGLNIGHALGEHVYRNYLLPR